MACRKKPSLRKEVKTVICTICKGDKKIQAKMKCCSPKMTSRDKGSWNF